MEPNLPIPNIVKSPKRYCLVCSNTVQEGSYCEDHKPDPELYNKGNNSQKWGKATNPFYYTAKWRKTTKAYRKANPLCEHCEEEGKLIPATQTDHITPISEGGAKFSWDNLQALCHSCHAKKSLKERND